MIVAVSMRVVENSTYPERRDAISHDWVRILDALPVTPVFVPNALANPEEYLIQVGAKGLILTGGDDLGPISWEPKQEAIPNERDRTESSLLTAALEHRLPVLGVCRGLHMVNVHFGGGVNRHLAEADQHINKIHPVEIVESSFCGLSWPDRIITNSYHGQGVRLSDLASTLKAFAIASGDVVEGLYHPELPVVAVQWHPERPGPSSDQDQVLLEHWIARCD